MNKQEFITTLRQGLDRISEEERREILYDAFMCRLAAGFLYACDEKEKDKKFLEEYS